MTIFDHLYSSSSSSFAKTHDNHNDFNYNYNNYDDAPYILLSMMDNGGGGLDLRGRTWNSPYNDTSKGDGTWFINKRYE